MDLKKLDFPPGQELDVPPGVQFSTETHGTSEAMLDHTVLVPEQLRLRIPILDLLWVFETQAYWNQFLQALETRHGRTEAWLRLNVHSQQMEKTAPTR
ncbi:hypothetical protein U0070_015364 [Myodes glareolus]|uniref:Uncharacterized protein n=1 Tax=Myodes glareolus TaxID=447135 RepID=A0AAW0JYX5_MYOGA